MNEKDTVESVFAVSGLQVWVKMLVLDLLS